MTMAGGRTGPDHARPERARHGRDDSELLAALRREAARQPGHAHAHRDLGSALARQGRLGEAIAWLRRAAALDADDAAVQSQLGQALAGCGQLDEAATCLSRAIALAPADRASRAHLAGIRQALVRRDAAIAPLRAALRASPGCEDPAALFDLGFALGKQGRLEEAADCYRRIVARNPDDLAAHNNLGNVLKGLGRLDEALACHLRVAALRPDLPALHFNLGNTLRALGRADEAAGSYRAALASKPDYDDARYALAMTLLGQGDLATGFAEYEWRWQRPDLVRARAGLVQPQWHGEEPPAGVTPQRTLLIHVEGGFGDTLQFCRYAALAAARGVRVILEAQKPLVRLLGALEGVDQVVASGEAPPAFDLHCPMLSLPFALGTTLETIPAAPAYLRPDPSQTDAMERRLAGLDRDRLDHGHQTGKRVGLVWAGDPGRELPAKAAIDQRRSIAPDRLAPLLDVEGVHFFSLQKNGPAAPASFGLTDLMEEMADFADTAALIANLDLVIAVDTAVAHLAAALGKPVWVIDRLDHCWRWLDGRADSPWYPTLRLYRQARLGEWDGVIDDAARDLRALVQG